MRKCILVKLDIFSKIGLGHFSRLNNLVNADSNNDYFLIYRTDINISELLSKSKFKKSFNIGTKESDNKWNNLENYKNLDETDFKKDISLIKSIINLIEVNYGVVHTIIIDNFLVKQEWFNIFSEELRLNKLNLIYVDDYNKDYNHVNLSIFYSSENNLLVNKNPNKFVAEGLKFTPFSIELVEKRNKIFSYGYYERANNIILSFGYFDQMNLSLEVISEILKKSQYNIIIIISKDAPIFKKLFVQYNSHSRVNIINYVPDLSSIYENCTTSIGTFGLMSLEKAFLALPQINILEEFNQKNTMRNLIKNNFAASFENISELFVFKNELFMFPKKPLYVDLLSKSKKLFGNGVLEWINLIEMISE